MLVPPSDAWKLVLAVVLGAAILVSVAARAPRRAAPGAELRRLVLSALVLYAVGGLASLTHRSELAALLYAVGITICAFAAWLSRGTDAGGPPGGHEPLDEQPPPAPDGAPEFDWAAFEREFRSWSAQGRADQERESAAVD